MESINIHGLKCSIRLYYSRGNIRLNSIKAKQYFLILLPVLFLLLSNVSKCEYQVYYCGLREALLSAVLRSKGDPITVQYLVTVSTHLAVLL